jgi:hypothetical protein
MVCGGEENKAEGMEMWKSHVLSGESVAGVAVLWLISGSREPLPHQIIDRHVWMQKRADTAEIRT